MNARAGEHLAGQRKPSLKPYGNVNSATVQGLKSECFLTSHTAIKNKPKRFPTKQHILYMPGRK